jgi:hypothetical protein
MELVPFDDRDGWIWWDGALVPWRDAKLHVLTHGLHYASAVFEGERAYAGNIFRLREHTDRLINSGRILGFEIPFSAEQIDAACDAVLAANYLKHRVGAAYQIPYDRPCKHEFVASAAAIKHKTGVRTLDIAKRLIDHGFHPPTIYFPLIVEEGMLIEPTETESVETLDAFADALIAIAAEAETDPDTIRSAPHTSPVRRLDEALAARHPNLRWRGMTGTETPCPD